MVLESSAKMWIKEKLCRTESVNQKTYCGLYFYFYKAMVVVRIITNKLMHTEADNDVKQFLGN